MVDENKSLVLTCIVIDAGDFDMEFKGDQFTITNPFGMWSGDEIDNLPEDKMIIHWTPDGGARYEFYHSNCEMISKTKIREIIKDLQALL